MSKVNIIPVYFVAKGETEKVYQHSLVSDGGHVIDLPGGCSMAYVPGEGYTITEELTPAEVAEIKAQKK